MGVRSMPCPVCTEETGRVQHAGKERKEHTGVRTVPEHKGKGVRTRIKTLATNIKRRVRRTYLNTSKK